MDKCATTSLLYGCETWGNSLNDVESCYRSGLKVALNVRQNLNNEIAYIESGRWPLHGRIKRLQLKFWLFVTDDYVVKYPDSAIAKVVKIGLEANCKFLKHYTKLYNEYKEPNACEESITKKYTDTWKAKVIAKFEDDPNSKLGTYYCINPYLTKQVQIPQGLMEFERELVTRFRTGSHSLAIEVGRYSNTVRENRLCKCGDGIQTVWHVISECKDTRDIVRKNYNDLKEVFDDKNIHFILLAITEKLSIKYFNK